MSKSKRTESKTLRKTNETISWPFGKINKNEKSLPRVIKKKKLQVVNIRNEKCNSTTDSSNIKKILREYYKKNANKLDTLDEIANVEENTN